MRVLDGALQGIYIEGVMPERALLRLKREGIAVYGVKKTQKTQIRLRVKKRDIEKVFAIYPSLCYNKGDEKKHFSTAQGIYTVRKAPATGVLRVWEFLKKRVGVCVGIAIFCASLPLADNLVFGVETVGADGYQREIYSALNENGVRLFSPYPHGKEDLICAEILSLNGVEFCSVQKKGSWVRVEIRKSPFITHSLERGDMLASRSGKIESITVLKGTALKKVGEEVERGEPLVGNWFSTETGERIETHAVARVRIACVYEGETEAKDEESAFAQAYLSLSLSEKDYTQEVLVQPNGDGGYFVRIAYSVVQSINL